MDTPIKPNILIVSKVSIRQYHPVWDVVVSTKMKSHAQITISTKFKEDLVLYTPSNIIQVCL